MSLLAAFMSGFLVGFGLVAGVNDLLFGGLVSGVVAGILRWCENRGA